MSVYDVKTAAALTHQDMRQLFDLDDDDLPTSNSYPAELLGHSFPGTQATVLHPITKKGIVDEWREELTQSSAPYDHLPSADETSADAGMVKPILTLLESAVLTQDVMQFQALVNAVAWSNHPPSVFVQAIRLALALEAPLIARKLAEQGTEFYPTHPEINKIARILAAPTAMPVTPSGRLNVKANKRWIQANRLAYRHKWVALHNGELIASGQTLSELKPKVGDIKGKGILITQVT